MRKLFVSLLFLSVGIQAEINLNSDRECLALNIYHEARGEHTAGMRAVADVVMNRVRSTQFPNTICDVIKQGPVYESWKTVGKDIPDDQRIYYPKRDKCQFSWYCDGKPDEPLELDSWLRAQEVANDMIDNDVGLGLTDGADHYYAGIIPPFWAQHMTFIVTIENHRFYRSK